MIVDELVTLLGLKADPKAAREAGLLQKLLGGVLVAAAAAGAALVSAATAIKGYAFTQAMAIADTKRFADTIDVSFERLQALEYAAKATGGSADELRGDLEKLTKSMSSPIPGEYNQTLYMLGISARDSSGKLRSADDVLLSIADKLQGMSKQRQIQFADRLGLSQTSLRLIQSGRVGINQLTKEAFDLGIVLDKQTGERALKFQTTLNKLQATIQGIGSTLSAALLPSLEKSVKWFSEWIKANRDLISTGITQIIEGVALGFQMIGSALSALWAWVQKILGPFTIFSKQLDTVQAIAVAVAIALGGMAVAVIAWLTPFAAAAAAVAAFVIVLEDLYTYLNGGESLIGEWADAFTKAYPSIAAVIGGITDAVKWLINLLGDVLPPVIKALLGGVEKLFSFWLSNINLLLTAYDRFLGLFRSAPDALVKFFAGMGNGLAITANAMASPIPGSVVAGAARAGGSGAGAAGNVTIQVNGAGDPSAVGAEVVRRAGLGESAQSIVPGMTGPQAY